MAHTTPLPSGRGFAIHNSDFSGEIVLVLNSADVQNLVDTPSEKNQVRVDVQFEDIKHLVASWRRNEIIDEVETASADDVLRLW